MSPIIVGIAGPSGAGKTTVADLLRQQYPARIEHVRQDYFLKSPRTFPKVFGMKNWELPGNVHFARLVRTLKHLKQGKDQEVVIVRGIAGYARHIVGFRSKLIILVEGSLLYTYPKLREIIDVKIFYELPEQLIHVRRQKRYKELFDVKEYDRLIAIPAYRKFGKKQTRYADAVIYAGRPLKTVLASTRELLKHFLAS